MTQPQIKPDLRVIRIDTTKYWSGEIQDRVEAIFAVCLFDANTHVFCCELTPSYELHYVGPTWRRKWEGDNDDEDLHEKIMDGAADEDEVDYVHVRAIDLDDEGLESIPVGDGEWGEALDEHDGDREAALASVMEREIERLRCNGWIY